MKFIRSIQKIVPSKPNGFSVIYMHGYGGRTWEARRHLNVLKKEGYAILAMDFVDILKAKNPQDLINLMDEASRVVKKNGLLSTKTIVVGISLGGLVGFNLIKRHDELDKLLVITGGDMTHIPSRKSLKTKWKLTRKQLSEKWMNVNIYTPFGELRDKHIIMMLPARDKVIDPEEVSREIDNHRAHNNIELVKTKGGHFRTIISETIVHPRRSLKLIDKLK